MSAAPGYRVATRTVPRRRPIGPVPEPTKGTYEELDRIAKELDVPHLGDRTLVCDLGEDRLTLDLDLNSGVVLGVTASIYGGPYPEIRFRTEKPEDLEAKDSGLSREIQIGDEDFDSRVYVETDAPDEVVHAVLDRSARDAILDMLEAGCTTVSFRSEGVQASLEDRRVDVCEPKKLKRIIDSLRVLARTTPVEDFTPKPSPLSSLLLLGGMPGMIVVILAHVKWLPHGPELSLVGAAVGLILGIFTRPLVRRAVSGTSTSVQRLRLSWIVVISVCAQLGCGIAVALNGALDASPVIQRDGLVTAVHEHDTEDHKTKVTVTWKGGVTETLHFHDEKKTIAAGAGVRETSRRGRLGFVWGKQTEATLGPNVWRD